MQKTRKIRKSIREPPRKFDMGHGPNSHMKPSSPSTKILYDPCKIPALTVVHTNTSTQPVNYVLSQIIRASMGPPENGHLDACFSAAPQDVRGRVRGSVDVCPVCQQELRVLDCS